MNRLPRTLIGVIVPLVLIGAGVGLRAMILERAVNSIENHRVEIQHLEGEIERHAVRPAIDGPGEDGSGWVLLRPAFDAVWDLDSEHEEAGRITTRSSPNYNARGIPADTDRLLEAAAPHLDACRRSQRRSLLDWEGAPDIRLPDKAVRTCRALSSKGFLSWQQGRDAEAVDWLLVALGVAHDAARLGQENSRELLRVVEAWVYEETRSLLSEHALTAAQFEDFERRLDLLRSLRPLPAAEIRRWGASLRSRILEQRVWVDIVGEAGESQSVELESTVGWRDLWSVRVNLARVLTGIRDAAQQSEVLPWNTSSELEPAWTSLCRQYRKEDVGQLWSGVPDFQAEVVASLRWDVLRIAVAVARFETTTGRMPLDVAETGVPVRLSQPAVIRADVFSVLLPRPGAAGPTRTDALSPIELEWTIRRR